MPQAPYIPAKDSLFDTWLLNYSTLLTANPTDFGLVAGDAVIVAARYTAWHAAYLLATNPATRTAPTVAAKDNERVLAEQIVRPYSVNISLNAAVSNLDKVAIGVNLPNTTPVPIPPPLTAPVLSLDFATPLAHKLAFKDSALGATKKKPYGSIGVQIVRAIGTLPAIDPSQATVFATWTKSPNVSTFVSGDVGKICTYWARFVTRSGVAGVASEGPWSSALALTIM